MHLACRASVRDEAIDKRLQVGTSKRGESLRSEVRQNIAPQVGLIAADYGGLVGKPAACQDGAPLRSLEPCFRGLIERLPRRRAQRALAGPVLRELTNYRCLTTVASVFNDVVEV